MSLLAATQIPKPADEQAFERASVVLWRGLLGDPNVQRNGRRGQRQNGVDLFGVRNADPAYHVGVQCKLKTDGHFLTAEEVRDEVRKALTFRPELREYFITTTSPDDVALQELARELAVEQKSKGRSILIYVWGWNTLEERISEDAAARKEFDPDYGAFSERILTDVGKIATIQQDIKVSVDTGVSRIEAKLARFESLHIPPGDSTTGAIALEAQIDAEIDEYRNLANSGKPKTALPLLERLLQRVAATASGRILFRVKANIGSCLLALGEDEKAAQLLSEAFDHAPTEPKAIANKAFALLLQGRWQELLSWGKNALLADPTNEGLASYLVQAARFDTSIADPLDLVPDALKNSAAVEVARIDALRYCDLVPDWWQAARAAVKAHPDDTHAQQFAAEADLDEVLQNEAVQRAHSMDSQGRSRVSAAVNVLSKAWNDARAGEGAIRPEHAALCSNLIVAYLALGDFPAAIRSAKEGIALAPDDVEIVKRAAIAAIEGADEELVTQVLQRLPKGPDATVLAFRYHSARGEWKEVAEIYQTQRDEIPEVERRLIVTAGRLAEAKVERLDAFEAEITAVASDAADDPRASIVVADFARMEGLDSISDQAFHAALEAIDAHSHIAARLMVAMHAMRRDEPGTVADLLDGHIAEDHDSEPLRLLARAFVNDSPIRQRAIRFFERLPASIRELPFYLHAEGLLHFNRGALREAENRLRKAIKVSSDLVNYLTLFATLRRSDRHAEIKPILEGLDLTTLKGTPGQKMYLAQELLAAGMPAVAFPFAYDVLQLARNDPEAALCYFGLMMLDPNGRNTPRPKVVGPDTWVRLEGRHGQTHSVLITSGPDRPADGQISITHPLAVAAAGRAVGDEFSLKAAFGSDQVWRIAEIKHKYLHALHDVMAHFQARFPDAKGFYTIKTKEGDVKPALDEIKKVSESNRKIADLYLVQHWPMSMIAARLGRDTVGFADYIRSLDHDIETCVGNTPERDAARDVIMQHRAAGAVLDTYAAWTAATTDTLDVLQDVFGKLVIPRSCLDELRSLRERDGLYGDGRQMTIAWHNGQFIRQEFTREDIQKREQFIAEQIQKIEKACEVRPGAAPDSPSELASTITDTFGSDVLDPAYVAQDGYVLVSDDLYYRQIASHAVAAIRGVWLQAVFAFAHGSGLIDGKRHADIAVKLAWRRHSHLTLDAPTLLEVWHADTQDDLSDFRALSAFIGTKNADMPSHLSVVLAFLVRIWRDGGWLDLKVQRATGILLEQLVRFRQQDWHLVLALIVVDTPADLQSYVMRWVSGHFLDVSKLREAARYVIDLRASNAMPRASRRPRKSKN